MFDISEQKQRQSSWQYVSQKNGIITASESKLGYETDKMDLDESASEYWKSSTNFQQSIIIKFSDSVTIDGFQTIIPDKFSNSAFKDYSFLTSYDDGSTWTHVIDGNRSKDCCFPEATYFSPIIGWMFNLSLLSNWGEKFYAIQSLKLSFIEGM